MPQEILDARHNIVVNLRNLPVDNELKKTAIEYAKKDIEILKEKISVYEKENKKLEEELSFCREMAEEYFKDYLDHCPNCGQSIKQAGSCNCVKYVDLPPEYRNNGQEKNLVVLECEDGRILGRIYLSKVPGETKKIIREINPITRPFDDIQVKRY